MIASSKIRRAAGHLAVVWAIAILCALTLAAPAWAKKATLAVSASAGETLSYRLEIQQEMNFGGVAITVNQVGNISVEAIEKSEKSEPRFAIRFSDFEGSVMRGGDLVEQEPPVNGVMVHATMSPRGELVDFAPQTSLSTERKELVKGLVENLFAYFPEKEIEPGDNWIQERLEESEDPNADKPLVEGSMEFTLDDWDKKDGVEAARIFGKGKADLAMPTPAGLFEGEAEGEWEGVVAVASGHVIECKHTVEISGRVGDNEISRAEYYELKLKK
jgi:hypothetical protein